MYRSYDDVMFREMDELMQERTINNELEEQLMLLNYYFNEIELEISSLGALAEELKDELETGDAGCIYDHILEARSELYRARDICNDEIILLEGEE